jgi:hypothetical protein
MGDLIQQALPWLTAALGGPIGLATMAANKLAQHIGVTAGAGSIVEDVKSVLKGFNPEQVAELKKIELDFQKEMKVLGYKHEEQLLQFDLDQIKTVNETIRVELQNSANEAWYQKAWRPACGFSVALGSFLGVIGTCYLSYKGIILKDANAMVAIPALATSIATILAIPGAAVGIAAWHRGMLQREQAQADGDK